MASKFSTALLILLTAVSCSWSQSAQVSDPADVVTTARSYATQGDRAGALKILNDRLRDEPADYDALTLRGTIRGWNKEFTDARTDLEAVLAAMPNHPDALLALINLELWAGNAEKAERLARESLANNPDSADMKAVWVHASAVLQDQNAALTRPAINGGVAPNTSEATRQWQVWVDHMSEWFSDGRSPWREESLAVQRQFRTGTAVATFSNAGRYDTTGQQMQVDYYPTIGKRTYFLLSSAFSPDASSLYPKYRAGVEAYRGTRAGYEGMLGYRRLKFGSTVHTALAGFSKYHGSWLFGGRLYITPETAAISRSTELSVRRFGATPTRFWSVRGIWGSSPTEVRSSADIGMLRSTSIISEISRPIRPHLSLLIRSGFSRQDRLERSGLYRVSLDASFRFHF
jgi:YaiO family outer membrane protein